MRKTAAALFIAALVVPAAFTQEKPLSPPAKAVGKIAGRNVTIEYSAPSKRGRPIMGALVPYAKVWRTGANDATTLTTDADLLIGGTLLVPRGTYTLFTVPREKEWELIVNKQTGQWGTQYDKSEDLGRVKMAVKPVKKTVETFLIEVNPTKGNNGVLTLMWENTAASVPLTVRK